MKLLDWMHRKFKQNNSHGEPFKDLGFGHTCNCLSGQPSWDEQQYQKCCYGTRQSKSQKDNLLHKSYGVRAEDEDYFDEECSDHAESGYFNGLLTIGTLGSDTVMFEPETPTFPVTAENVTEKETDITENDLRVINEELEKVLGANVKEDKWTDSSGRTSHVSTITLSGTEGIAGVGSVCPLQGYLLGSGLSEPELAPITKKENRTSLGELFQKTKLDEGVGEKEEKKGDREEEKSAKKTLKKRLLGSSAAADSATADKKLKKILQMFHRKVHPEGSAGMKKSSKLHKNDIKNSIPQDSGGSTNGDHSDDTATLHKISVSKEHIRRLKSHPNPHHFAISRSDSNGKREYWIKTDADYLVLEL